MFRNEKRAVGSRFELDVQHARAHVMAMTEQTEVPQPLVYARVMASEAPLSGKASTTAGNITWLEYSIPVRLGGADQPDVRLPNTAGRRKAQLVAWAVYDTPVSRWMERIIRSKRAQCM